MRIIENLKEMTETARGWLASGTVGFVPLKSSIHDGHKALILAAHKACEITVVGLLGPAWPFDTIEEREQRLGDLEHDLQELERCNVDVVFIPRFEDLYPFEFATYVIPFSPVVAGLDSTQRSFFQMFTTLSMKLFHLIRPDVVYLGQKDAQLVSILRQVMRDLNIDMRIRVQTTVRDSDGLALSSRNSQLLEAERHSAVQLYQSLLAGKALIERGERRSQCIEQAVEEILRTNHLIMLDFVRVCHADTFLPLAEVTPGMMLAVAARIGSVHLIDNIVWVGNGQWRL